MSDLHLRYLGSKKTLLPHLEAVFRRYVRPGMLFGDYFAGTGAVAHMVSSTLRCPVLSNDAQYYSYVINQAMLAKYSKGDVALIKQKLAHLNALPPAPGFIARHYAPPARMFFTQANAAKIDAMRGELERQRQSLPPHVYLYLLAKILRAADRAANTTCVYAAYLKQFKPSSLAPLKLAPYLPNRITTDNKVFNCDAAKLARTGPTPAVAYLDPPYNGTQYATRYHLLDTIAKYDQPSISGKAGLRADPFVSKFARVTGAEKAFVELVRVLRRVPVLIVSYSDEGIIPHRRIEEILARHGPVTVHKFPHKKYRSHGNVCRKRVLEYVFVAQRHT